MYKVKQLDSSINYYWYKGVFYVNPDYEEKFKKEFPKKKLVIFNS